MTSPPSLDISAAELEEEVRSYRQARAARLTSKNGWLSLIDKVWLDEGVHRIGAADGSEIRLPEGKSPALVGMVERLGDVVTLRAAPGVELRARGEIVTSLVLRSDTVENPDVVTFGTFSFELLRRGDDFAFRVRDTESPMLRAFRGVPAYPVDPTWRVVARLERYPQEREVILEDGDGRPQPYTAPGIAAFERAGVTYRLEPVYESDRRRLFVLFSDRTNADETYGAGRFLYAPLPQSDRVVLDFNKAFNPPCAFTPHAVCPLPAPNNRLLLRVEAGEKRPYDSD
jgi:uncharacterized protein (DUF1684 family)